MRRWAGEVRRVIALRRGWPTLCACLYGSRRPQNLGARGAGINRLQRAAAARRQAAWRAAGAVTGQQLGSRAQPTSTPTARHAAPLSPRSMAPTEVLLHGIPAKPPACVISHGARLGNHMRVCVGVCVCVWGVCSGGTHRIGDGVLVRQRHLGRGGVCLQVVVTAVGDAPQFLPPKRVPVLQVRGCQGIVRKLLQVL